MVGVGSKVNAHIARAYSGALLLSMLSVGCAQQAKSNPAALTEKITRAVYANDLETATADFDDDLKKEVTRANMGTLSDTMHQLGAMKGITQRSADPDKGRYDYDVTFERGAMIAQIRLDPSGKVGAYRLIQGDERRSH